MNNNKEESIINMAAFCNGIRNANLLVPNLTNRLGELNKDNNPIYSDEFPHKRNRPCIALANYFSVIDENIERKEVKQFCLGNAGVPILLYIFEPILARIGFVPAKADLGKYVKIIKLYFDLEYENYETIKRLSASTTSEGARKSIARDIGKKIREELKDDKFWPRMEQEKIIEEIKDIERRLGKVIEKELSNKDSDWKTHRISDIKIRELAFRRSKAEGISFDECLSLGDEIQIIIQGDNWDEVFNDFFVKKGTFNDKSDIEVAFKYLSLVRNPESHGRSAFKKSIVDMEKKDLDVKLSEAYIEKFDSCLPPLYDEKIEGAVEG